MKLFATVFSTEQDSAFAVTWFVLSMAAWLINLSLAIRFTGHCFDCLKRRSGRRQAALTILLTAIFVFLIALAFQLRLESLTANGESNQVSIYPIATVRSVLFLACGKLAWSIASAVFNRCVQVDKITTSERKAEGVAGSRGSLNRKTLYKVVLAAGLVVSGWWVGRTQSWRWKELYLMYQLSQEEAAMEQKKRSDPDLHRDAVSQRELILYLELQKLRREHGH